MFFFSGETELNMQSNNDNTNGKIRSSNVLVDKISKKLKWISITKRIQLEKN